MTKTAITGAATDSATIRKIADEAFAAPNRGAGQVLLPCLSGLHQRVIRVAQCGLGIAKEAQSPRSE